MPLVASRCSIECSTLQGGQKVLHLWHHSQKICIPQPKNFFWVQTTRLASSFDGLTRSVTRTGAEIFPCKATCESAVFLRTAWINPDIKVLKMTFHHNVKKNLFHNSTNIPAFFRCIGWPEGPEIDIVASNDSISHLIYEGFSMIHPWRACATALLVELVYFHRYVDLSLSQNILQFSVLNKWCFGLLNSPNLLIKATRNNCKYLNILNQLRSDNFQKTFQNINWLVNGDEVWMRSWVRLKHPWQARIKW